MCLNYLLDINGNIYFELNDSYYELYVENNEIIIDKLINFNFIINKDSKKNKLILNQKKENLKKKIKHVLDLDEEGKEESASEYYKYLFEYEYFDNNYDDNSLEQEEEYVDIYYYDENNNIIKNIINEDSDIPLFELIIIKDNKPQIQTKLMNINCIYMIKINIDENKIYFRPILNENYKEYNIIIKDDTLILN
jgi:hypothetical protein